MNECDLCFNPTRNRKRTGPHNELLCNECRFYEDYWNGLSEEDKQAELKSIARYVEEATQLAAARKAQHQQHTAQTNGDTHD